jgi:oxygen-independent coproporphyrinogen-3 oxidase
MLQLERGTPLYKSRNKLNIPDSDKTAELYMLAVESLEKEGFSQYEVSNFCKKGYFSRHNKKYWCLEEYLGIGPAAHSFMQGKRFHFEADLEKFIKGADVIDDGIGATAEEYIMLSLRLVEGLDINKLKTDYGLEINKRLQDFLTKAQAEGYLLIEDNRIKLKTKGFLMQNPLIAEILDLMNI